MSEPVNIVVEKYDNETLAKHNEALFEVLIKMNRENDKLTTENAKLRKLVKGLYGCAEHDIPAKACTKCNLFDGNGGCLDLTIMQELGINPKEDQ